MESYSTADQRAILTIKYKIMKKGSMSEEEAEQQAIEMFQITKDDEIVSDEDEVLDSRRRLKQQERKKEALSMLNRIKTYSGTPQRFDIWIEQFENAIIVEDYSDPEIVRMLASKLADEAADSFITFKKAEPLKCRDYKAVKQHLMGRFHGAESTDSCEQQFENCKQKARESIADYAARLEKLFNYAYPSSGTLGEGNQNQIPNAATKIFERNR